MADFPIAHSSTLESETIQMDDAYALTPFTQQLNTHNASNGNSIAAHSSSPYNSPTSKQGPGCRHIMHAKDGREQYYGPTFLLSLIKDVDEFILSPIASNGNGSGNIRTRQHIAFARTSLRCLEETHLSDGSPSHHVLANDLYLQPSSPPVTFLTSLIDPYFDSINAHFPLWSKESFKRLVELAQTPNCDAVLSRAYAVCSNSLILLSLATKSSLQAGDGDKNQSPDPRQDCLLSADLTRSFLANAKRAIQHQNMLLSPYFVNVQALLSLVSQHLPIRACLLVDFAYLKEA